MTHKLRLQKRVLLQIVLLFFCYCIASAQKSNDSAYIQAKIWSRDANRNIQYSDWQIFGCKTVDLLKDFSPLTKVVTDKYGGEPSLQFKSTPFFYTVLKDNRWWIVDPQGNSFVNVAVNGVRLGKSPNNAAAFATKFTTNIKWIEETKKMLDDNGFNTTGSWSDVEAIKAFNINAVKPIVYSTQLSLLGTFSQQKNQKSGVKNYPVLAHIFNPAFKIFCADKAKELAASKDDSNLFGHFSDNELPFQENLITVFLTLNDATDSAYQTVIKWVADNKIDITNISKAQKETFSGFVANEYYKTMRNIIKTADPNHLYLGSRLHASAKNNSFILAAAEKYLDIISINYYGNWAVSEVHKKQWEKLTKPFIITEFYTKGEDSKMGNMTGAGWLVKTQTDRGIYYQNFCLNLLQIKNCVGWHWFRYQDNDPNDKTADPSNNDANKGIVNTSYESYPDLLKNMKQLNTNIYSLIKYFDRK